MIKIVFRKVRLVVLNIESKYDLSILKSGFSSFGLELSKEQYSKFIKYYELLIEWNSFMNLTAITDFKEVCVKHFIDSVSLCKAVSDIADKKYTVIDIVTGAGFPSIPLKIVFPNLKITMLDSLGKRIKFLNEVISQLDLRDIEAIHGRAEDYAKPNLLREKFDICVSRAVANISTLSEYCIPYVKNNGYFISYKSEKIADEIEQSGNAITILGGEISKQVEFILPESDIFRNLFVIKKTSVTPKKFPRKAGLPSKEPLK